MLFVTPSRLRAPYMGFLCLLLALAGCSSTPSHDKAVQADQPSTERAEILVKKVPDRPFEVDTLYALLVAEIAGSRKRYDIALNNYIQQASATRDINVVARATRIARLLNARKAALEMSLLWLDLEAENPEARQIAASELAQANRLLEAVEQSEWLLQHQGKTLFEGIAAKAIQTRNKSSLAELDNKYRQLLELYPTNTQIMVGYSLLRQASGDNETALKLARQALKLDNKSQTAAIQEARILQMQEDSSTAFKRLAELVELQPKNQRLRLQYARLLMNSDLAKAQEQFQILLEQSPNDGDIALSIALIQQERGYTEESKTMLQRLLGSSKHSSTAHFYLGKIAASENDPATALNHFDQVENSRDYVPAVAHMAEILLRQNAMQQAIERIQSKRQSTSGDQRTSLYLLESNVLNSSGKVKAATEALNSGLQEYPTSIKLLYARAMIFANKENVSGAEKDLIQIIELAPNNAAALNALGYTLADQTDRIDEAYTYIKKALAISPNDPAVLDSMGWVEYKRGNLPQALSLLQQAMANMADAEIAAHLGEVYWVLGEHNKAQDTWQKGLKVKPDSKIILDTMDRLGAAGNAE